MITAARLTALALVLLAGGCREPLVRREPPLSTVAPPAASVAAEPSTPSAPAPARPSDQQLLALPDARPRAEPRARLGNPVFYEVYGQRYTVLAASHGYLERGVASWYGADFHGGHTSTGEPYDMYSMTAAHRTLPLPAYVRVTNLRNGRAVVVRVNDRGPFKSNRIIDMSYAAALKLDMVRDGTTLVEVAAVETDDPAPPPGNPPILYAQTGAFTIEANATKLRDSLDAQGVRHVSVQADAAHTPPLYRVRVGPIQSVPEYDAIVARLKLLGVANPKLVTN